MIDIKLYNIAELEKLTNSEEFYNFKNIPISLHRAKSHFKNPRADSDDTIMIIAYNNGEIAGYMGILPDFIYSKTFKKDQNIQEASLRGTKQSNQETYTNVRIDEVEKVKFGWFSCFWVDESLRGEGVGTKLVEKALQEWNDKILITEFAPLSKKLYLKTKSFEQSITLSGIRLYNRFDFEHLLPHKKAVFQKVKGLLKFTDIFLNSIFDIRFLFTKKKTHELQLEKITDFNAETESFITENNNSQIFKRGAIEFEWILNFPWILVSDKIDSLNKKYYFSSVAKSFEYFCYNLRNANNKIVAFMIFSKRENTLKLPYCIYKAEYLPEVINLILQRISELKISTFTTYNNEISKVLLRDKTHSLYKKKMTREYLISNNLKEYFIENNFQIQDGDGDCVFT